MMRGTQSRCSVTLGQWGAEGGGEGRGLRREGKCICLWPIHVDVWQKYHNKKLLNTAK